MAVKIRLKRMGKIRAPFYRVVVMDSRAKRDGRAIEEIGKYHPTEEPSLIDINSERAQYWLGQGAQPTEAVAALLKITGDWQKYKGEPGTEGTLKVKAAKTVQEGAVRGGDRRRRQVRAPAPTAPPPRRSAPPRRPTTPKADEPKADEAEGRRAEGRRGRGRAARGCRRRGLPLPRRLAAADEAKAETEEAPAAAEADAADKA